MNRTPSQTSASASSSSSSSRFKRQGAASSDVDATSSERNGVSNREAAKTLALRTLLRDRLEQQRTGAPAPRRAATVASRKAELKRLAREARVGDAVESPSSAAAVATIEPSIAGLANSAVAGLRNIGDSEDADGVEDDDDDDTRKIRGEVFQQQEQRRQFAKKLFDQRMLVQQQQAKNLASANPTSNPTSNPLRQREIQLMSVVKPRSNDTQSAHQLYVKSQSMRLKPMLRERDFVEVKVYDVDTKRLKVRVAWFACTR